MKNPVKAILKKRGLLGLMTTLFFHAILIGQTYTIPTVVHIISPNAQNDLLTDAQVQNGIANINKQFDNEPNKGVIKNQLKL